MTKPYRLYWVRHKRCDFGTPMGLADLDAGIRNRVAALTNEGEEAIPVRLPYLDARELRTRSQAMQSLRFFRDANGIRGILPMPLAEVRDKAAWLAAGDPAWREAPGEDDLSYGRTWQKVAVGLQTALRRWIPEAYFADVERLENREESNAMIVYSVCRPFPGRSRTEFVYDVADEETIEMATRWVGAATQQVLAKAEARLAECGKRELAHRYSPFWHEDVIRAVRQKPMRLISLLGDEGMLINAVIQLGVGAANGDTSGVKRFARMASLATRTVFGMDLRPLLPRVLDETTRILTEAREAETARAERRAATSRSRQESSHPPSSAPDTSCHCMPGSAACR
ncbi:MAG: hypothetical protein ABL967_12385 [Bryobacteraceae bacterium]